jgi:hypothetical protein
MSDEFFGELKDPDGERPLLVLWPLHAVNVIEQELNGLMCEALSAEEHRAPMIWCEDESWNSDAYADYGPISVHEAIALRDIVHGDVQERFRRQLIVARELGKDATLELYLIACAAEGIDPILGKDNGHGFNS